MSTTSGSLAGRRIVVTRRTHQASRLIRLLEERGAVVLKVPATAIGPPEDPAPLDEALRGLDRFDWVAFTESKFIDTSDPVGSLLTTGGPGRYRDHNWTSNSGVRRRAYSGGRFEISQQLGYQDNNYHRRG